MRHVIFWLRSGTVVLTFISFVIMSQVPFISYATVNADILGIEQMHHFTVDYVIYTIC